LINKCIYELLFYTLIHYYHKFYIYLFADLLILIIIIFDNH